MPFRTQLDFSSNRQVKQHPETFTVLSGGTSFGVPFSALTSSPDLSTSGVSAGYSSIVSTFSGNTGTTNYTFSDTRMQLGISALSALTPSNSGITQTTGLVFTANTTTVIDGNTVILTYSGVSYDITVSAMTDLGSGAYSGTVTTDSLAIISANTAGYTGRTIWVDVSGITRTNDLIITSNPIVGYVWTCSDSEGKGSWEPSSGGTGTGSSVSSYVLTTGFTSGVTITVPHNLGTLDFLVQIKDLTANELVGLTVDNYQLNSVDITSNFTLPSARIMILSGGASSGGTNNFWTLSGNSGTVDGTNNFIGTTDINQLNIVVGGKKSGRIDGTLVNSSWGWQSFSANTTGNNNTGIGYATLSSNITGNSSTAIGSLALQNNNAINNTGLGAFAMLSNIFGINNVGAGTSALYNNSTGHRNSALGVFSLGNNTIGMENTAVGYNAISNNISGDQNTAVGIGALSAITTVSLLTAVGYAALRSNTSGTNNVAVGANALSSNLTSSNNTAVGKDALKNSTQSNNTAIGYNTLVTNTIGGSNTAVGSQALTFNTTGTSNTAVGLNALVFNTGGGNNTALGVGAMTNNTTGGDNTAVGDNALYSNSTGGQNVSVGYECLYNNLGNNNTAVGYLSLYFNGTGTGNTAIGYGSGVNSGFSTLSNATAIGYNAIVAQSNRVQLGSTSVTAVTAYAAYSNISDGRFKININENIKGLEFINKLRPISYQFDRLKLDEFNLKNLPEEDRKKIISETDYSSSNNIHNGFIAQEVEQAALDCGFIFDGVQPANENGTYSLSYSQFVVPIIKAIQELSSGVTSTNNTLFETQTILAEDNNIELNFSGTPETALGGGITVLHAMGKDKSAEIKTDSDGNWITNNDLKPKSLTIPLYTPSGSTDTNGNIGNITRDNNYLYIKDTSGWGRTKIERF